MKTLSILFLAILCIPCVVFALEPVGTIGQPRPDEHAFLPNGFILRAVNTHIQVVHPDTGAVIDEFGERADSSDVVFSPTAEHLAILDYIPDSKTTTVTIWDVNARQQLSKWEVPARIRSGAFNPKRVQFAIPFNDEIQLWNWKTGGLVGTMTGQRRPVKPYSVTSRWGNRMVFSPDGRHLIVSSKRSDIELWNIETRRLEAHFEADTGAWVNNVAISPDGTVIATVEPDSPSVYLWDVKTQQLLWRETIGISRISGFVFSPDSQRLYVATITYRLSSNGGIWRGWDDRVRVWDVISGKQIDAFETEFRSLKTITLSLDGKTALLHYQDAVVLWDIEAKQKRNVFADFVSGSTSLSPDGQTVVSVSPYFIKIWDVPSRQLRQLSSAEGWMFQEFAISPDSKKFAVGRDDWIQVRNISTGKVETQISTVERSSDIAFSRSGKWIAATGGWTGATGTPVCLFDIENLGQVQRTVLDGGPDSLYFKRRFAFSENDQYLVASGNVRNDGRIWLWRRDGDTFTFQYTWKTTELSRSTNSRPTFALDRDGSTVLALPGRENLQIWKLTPHTPQLVSTLEDVGYYTVHFSPDGRYLFADKDDHLQIWDWQANTVIDHPPVPRYRDISRDGSVLIAYDNASRIQVWDATRLLPPPEAVAVEPRGKQIVTFGEIKRNQLLQNYPNPFNPETWIPFRLATESIVTIRIYTPTGQLIRTLPLDTVQAGDYSTQSKAAYWDGRNQMGEWVSSGTYLYTINADNFSATRKMLIQK